MNFSTRTAKLAVFSLVSSTCVSLGATGVAPASSLSSISSVGSISALSLASRSGSVPPFFIPILEKLGLRQPAVAPVAVTSRQGQQIVAFGDSFSANAGKDGQRRDQPSRAPFLPYCATDKENWPKLAAAQLHKTLADWSCNGTGFFLDQLMAYVNIAIDFGDIGPATEKVVLMYGGLDLRQWGDVAGQLVFKPAAGVRTPFKDYMVQVVNRIHQVAPQAKIVMASYPEFATNGWVCLFNGTFLGNIGLPIPGSRSLQRSFRDSLKATAEHVGADFIDVYEKTIGHGTCAARPEDRYVAGIRDVAAHTLPAHPTIAGEYAMAKIIADALAGK